jgi:hypothetical protein
MLIFEKRLDHVDSDIKANRNRADGPAVIEQLRDLLLTWATSLDEALTNRQQIYDGVDEKSEHNPLLCSIGYSRSVCSLVIYPDRSAQRWVAEANALGWCVSRQMWSVGQPKVELAGAQRDKTLRQKPCRRYSSGWKMDSDAGSNGGSLSEIRIHISDRPRCDRKNMSVERVLLRNGSAGPLARPGFQGYAGHPAPTSHRKRSDAADNDAPAAIS